MPKGGRRPGAGRPPGSLNKRSREKAAAIEASGLTPLDYMISVMRNEKAETPIRLDAAKSAAPYVHARLHATELSTPDPADGLSEEEIKARLRDLVKSYPEVALILAEESKCPA